MSTTLATKHNLEMLQLATKHDFVFFRQELRHDIRLLKQEMNHRFALVDQKFDSLELRLVVKLGSLMAAGFGLTIAVLQLWA